MSLPGWTADTRPLLGGAADGLVLLLHEPLSFWGGVDPATGVIVEARHPQHGKRIGGTVLAMPAGRGSSSSSSVIAEAIRLGNGPLAVLISEPDEIIVVGALVAQLLDGATCPVALLEPADYARLRDGDHVRLDEDGRLRVDPGSDRPPEVI